MANDTRPSESAAYHFDQAKSAVEFATAGGDTTDYLKRLARSNHSLAAGLKELTVALRATYILLEQVNRKLNQ
jgi:hypothetical protein